MYILSRFGESDIKAILKKAYNCLQKELRGENAFLYRAPFCCVIFP